VPYRRNMPCLTLALTLAVGRDHGNAQHSAKSVQTGCMASAIERTVAGAGNIHLVHRGEVVHPIQTRSLPLVIPG